MLGVASRIITIIALCSAVGGQWFALQSVAWTTMMVRNAKQVSFCEAVKRTFDGAHPCALCHVVNKGKASEQKREMQTSFVKIDIVCVSRKIPLLPRQIPFEYFTSNDGLSETDYSPPVPPPRPEFG
jgi:hypothetical protein